VDRAVWDTNEDGQADRYTYDRNGDGRWDAAEEDTNFDGRIDHDVRDIRCVVAARATVMESTDARAIPRSTWCTTATRSVTCSAASPVIRCTRRPPIGDLVVPHRLRDLHQGRSPSGTATHHQSVTPGQ
jgi:hypothetical protein